METVLLQPLFHRGQQCIGIYFLKNSLLQNLVQKQAGAKWSQSNMCWHIACTKENFSLLAKALSGNAILETTELKNFLIERKKDNPPQKPGDEKKTVLPMKQEKLVHL